MESTNEVGDPLGYVIAVYRMAYHLLTMQLGLRGLETMRKDGDQLSALGEEMTMKSVSLLLSWLRVGAQDSLLHYGGGTGRLLWHARIMRGVDARYTETDAVRALLWPMLTGGVRRQFWRWPEVLCGIGRQDEQHPQLFNASVIILSDAHATTGQIHRLDERLARGHFRAVVSYHPESMWKSLRPHTKIDPPVSRPHARRRARAAAALRL